MRALAAIPLLTLVYALTLASFDPLDLAAGALIAAGLLALFRPFLDEGGKVTRTPRRSKLPSPPRRLAAFPPFVVATTVDIIRGTWTMTLIVLHVRPLAHPGIVAVPIGDRTPRGVAVSALATTLSPGTFLVDVDWENSVMLIHLIDASDPDAVRASLEHFYQRWQRGVFP